MATMNISLPDEMKKWVEDQVATGRYANTSDYVRDLLREKQNYHTKLLHLRQMVAEGEESGVSHKSREDVMEEARRRAREQGRGD